MKQVLIFFAFFLVTHLIAQPSSTPAAGYNWESQGCSIYTDGPYFTGGGTGNNSVDCGGGPLATMCGANDTSFGWNVQCSTSPSTTVGTPGANFIQSQVFGNFGTGNNLEGLAVPCNPGVGGTGASSNWPNSTTETRRIVMSHWNNANPHANVANGATAGTVWIAKSIKLNFRDDGVGDGTGAGADELKFLIIGGDGGGNSSWQINASYDLSILVSGAYGGVAGINGTKINEFIAQTLTNTPDAGAGNAYHLTDNNFHNASCGGFQSTEASWYFPGGTNTGSYGTGYSECFNIPVGNVVEDGSQFNVDFTSGHSINLSRTGSCNSGGSDARATLGPGLGGKVELIVEYEIWEIVQETVPVTLTDFKAKKESAGIQLSWVTNSEINTNYVALERSLNNKDWNVIYKTRNEGDSKDVRFYDYFDNSPGLENFYRLRIVDFDGSEEFSEIITASFDQKNDVSFGPNPFSSALTIYSSLDDVRYKIRDSQGRVTLEGSEKMIDTFKLDQGVFWITVYHNNKVVANQKILKFN